jgi:hypothetical protein
VSLGERERVDEEGIYGEEDKKKGPVCIYV